MSIDHFNKIDKLYILKVFLSVFGSLLVIFFLIAMIQNYQTRTETIDRISHQEELIIDGVRERITDYLTFITSDLLYVKSEFEMNYTSAADYNEIADDWLIYSSERNLYRQIRFIDKDGMEQIRINNDGDNYYVVDQSELQDKNGRYYFEDAVVLPENSIYYSSMDLNVENGEIVVPYELQFRLATPVYEDDEVLGIIILNFDIDYTLNKMPYYDETSNGEFYVTNDDGYFIFHINPDYQWGYDLPERAEYTLSLMYPEAWEQLETPAHEFSNQVITNDGLFSCYNLTTDDITGFDDYDFYTAGAALHLVTYVPRSVNHYLFSSNIFVNMLAITAVNGWLFILSILLLSIIITLIIYIRLQFLYEQKYYASTDQLTGVFNRNYGINALEQSMKDTQNLSVCFIDLNGLKHINDTFGHESGDNFIKQSIDVIKNLLEFPDYLFRLGGDEFIIVSHQPPEVVERLWDKITETYQLINESHMNEFDISVSHGIVKFRKTFKDVNQLIAEADKLMYLEKQKYYKENGQK